MTTVSLKFEDLLYQALLEWPKDFILNESIFILDNSINKKIYIENLFNISQEQHINCETYDLYDVCLLIEKKYFGTIEEVILRHIHASIRCIIYKSDLYKTNKTVGEAILNIKDFNKFVRLDFEESIKELFEENYIEHISIDAPLKSEWNWSYESLMLIKKYFEVNNVDMNSIS